MTTSAPTQRHGAEDPEVRAALNRISAVIQRALMRVMANEERAARRAAAENPPDAHKKGPAPHHAPASSSHLSTATAPLSTGEGRHAYS
jgi:septal ring factor EnvC (AmiA/AmiB activator)